MKRNRKSRPYIMRGEPRVSEPRATILDPPDSRVTVPRKPPLPIEKLRQLAERETKTDVRLLAVDRCFERWAATPVGDIGIPRMTHVILIGRSGEGGHVPLDDLESKIVDTAVRTSPGWARRFVQLWYRSDMSVTDIARELAIKRREYVYKERDIVLSYFYGALSVGMVQLELGA
jgi:hypothetical protein